MKFFIIWVSLIAALSSTTLSAAQPATSLDGTLYKKQGKWFLFVESDKASFKKGSVQLVLSPSTNKLLQKYLIAQSYVTVSGVKTNCDSRFYCIEVDSIAPALYDPLKKKIARIGIINAIPRGARRCKAAYPGPR